MSEYGVGMERLKREKSERKKNDQYRPVILNLYDCRQNQDIQTFTDKNGETRTWERVIKSVLKSVVNKIR